MSYYNTTNGIRRFYRFLSVAEGNVGAVTLFDSFGFVCLPLQLWVQNRTGGLLSNVVLNGPPGALTDTFTINSGEAGAPLMVPVASTVLFTQTGSVVLSFNAGAYFANSIFVSFLYQVIPV